MSKQNESGIEEYIRRITPQLGYYYGVAHAMTGSQEAAEMVLDTALSSGYATGASFSGAPLRMSILHCMREETMRWQKRLSHAPEVDWKGLRPTQEESTLLTDCVASLPIAAQRILILRYGCDFSAHLIAPLLQIAPDAVKSSLSKSRRVLHRALGGKEKAAEPLEQQLSRELRRCLNHSQSSQADIGQILRTLEEEIRAIRKPRRRVSRLIRAFFLALMVALLVALLWAIAVLLEM